LLNSEGVEYLLLGGYAVGYYGYPRATADMDIWVAIGAENIGRLRIALQRFGFSAASLPPDLLQKTEDIVRIGMPPLRIDLLASPSGVDFNACYANRAVASIDGVEVSVISLDDLKKNKAASGRLKDLNDLQNLP
jgi:hypothetical protein